MTTNLIPAEEWAPKINEENIVPVESSFDASHNPISYQQIRQIQATTCCCFYVARL